MGGVGEGGGRSRRLLRHHHPNEVDCHSDRREESQEELNNGIKINNPMKINVFVFMIATVIKEKTEELSKVDNV